MHPGSLRITIGDVEHMLELRDALTFSPRQPPTQANASATQQAMVL